MKFGIVYCDMDGVLCNFKEGVESATGQPFKDFSKKDEKIVKAVKAVPDFWARLPWQEGGFELWNGIVHLDPHILSAHADWDLHRCIQGKHQWIGTNLGGMPKNKINIVEREDKAKFATINGMRNLLIDDYEKNITAFDKAGGIGILHKNTSNTLAILKAMGILD